MDWKTVGETMGKAAPVLGALLGTPAAASIGALIASALGTTNSPEGVANSLSTNPDAFVKLKEIEAKRQVDMQGLLLRAESLKLAAETSALESVNATMRAEVQSEHWPSYTWRPFLGFILGVMLFGIYFVLPLSKLPVPVIPESVWITFASILGVASWFRGKAQADPENQAPVKG